MLFLIRSALLLILIVTITVFGTLICLVAFRSKNRVYYIGQVFSKAALLFGLSVEKRLSPFSQDFPQAVYIANHQNNFDLFTLSALLPKNVATVGKQGLRWIPFFGTLYWASGNILIDRNNRRQAIKTIDQVVGKMKRSTLSVWMFPEGSRSRGRGWLPFKRGAFHAAIQAGVPVVPVVCSNTHRQVNLNRLNNGKVIVEMLDPIETKGLSEADIVHLITICEKKMFEAKARLDLELTKN